MPWTKTGDNAATDPRLLRVDTDPDAQDWSLNEVAGFVLRAYFQAAGHMTDYLVDLGTLKMLGNGRHEHLIALAVRAGLLIPAGGRGRAQVFKLLEDPEFVHIQRREEVEWNRQRDKDRRNPDLTIPVRRRDGDACRYCGVVVSWTARRGVRAGTYDHVAPGQPATVDTYVVCCGRCNSTRKADPAALTLRPVPDRPIYSAGTLRLLATMYVAADLPPHIVLDPDNASATPAEGSRATTRPGSVADNASATPAEGARATTRPAADVPGPGPDLAVRQVSRVDAGSGRVGPGQVRSGRVGTERVGTGRSGSDSPPLGRPGSRSRRRGRRSRGSA